MPLRKISRLEQDFIDLIYKLAEISNIELTEYIVKFGCEDIDSFLTGLFKVDLTGIRDGQKIKRQVLLKWHPEAKMRSCFRECYKREVVFYQHIMPKFLNIQNDFKNIEGLKIKFPNCIYASSEYDKETIATLVLRDTGFRLRNRLDKPDVDHVALVMKNLAKLHALSFALEKTNPKDFEEITRLCHKDVQYSNPGSVPKSMRSYYDASVDLVIDPVAKKELRKVAPEILNILYRCVQANPHSTICHGDCWNNNMIFKYKGFKPVDVIFFDYQLTRYASPVTDISYYLYMSTDGEFLRKHYSFIIEIYYGTLSAVLRQCDLDVDEIYPRSIFEKHLKDYSVLGLLEALVSMMIITAPYEEAIKMTEMKYEHEDEEIYENGYQNHNEYADRVNGIVNDFFERNYSLDALLSK
ncbi:unnamed protein product [Chrysodeixis includens]|uniref:CHK kinase-like domain-containing protein n=1 Tax=Chrysodeixis includens TaxID=689277 RepID=A0A9N8KTF5_CHRIL|nr:unnamed protein product [Chrysodeixis includens]